ncbi:MAG TPA: energy transducer TonB, partial [Longimicrobiaceae bacterium]|nr:energy transducer TonB [Longimicrobiaceae bacterium]
IAGAVYASVHMPQTVKKAQELVTYMEVKEKPPEPAKPTPPPPPPPEAPKPATPPPPKGFQELMPPKTPPPAIPDINPEAPPVDPKDFTGIGQAGGTHNGVQGGTPQNANPADSSNFVYQSQQLDAPPHITNGSQVQSALSRMYPRMLQDAGISGTTVLEFTVEKDGTVDGSTVKVISTTNEQFSDPARRVAERMHFTPPMYRGHAVRTLVQMPIQWKPES